MHLKSDAVALNLNYAKFISSMTFLETVFDGLDKVILIDTEQYIQKNSKDYKISVL